MLETKSDISFEIHEALVAKPRLLILLNWTLLIDIGFRGIGLKLDYFPLRYYLGNFSQFREGILNTQGPWHNVEVSSTSVICISHELIDLAIVVVGAAVSFAIAETSDLRNIK